MLPILEIIFTVTAWRRGWRWRALLPMGFAVFVGFIMGVAMVASSDGSIAEAQSLLEKIRGPAIFLDLVSLGALITMSIRAPRKASEVEYHFDTVSAELTLSNSKDDAAETVEIDQNEELNNYLLKAQGISRTGLNVMAFTGLFIFGWLIAAVFGFLGKAKQGWTYLVSIVILYAWVGAFAPELAVLAPLIYIAAWVHANRILSRYQSAARRRIAEMDRQREIGIDTLLEKGLILHKVLREDRYSVEVLNDALRVPGGNPLLLNQAGIAMSANRRYREAAAFFDRALLSTQDEALIKQIEKNHRSAEKKLTRLAGDRGTYAYA